MNLIKHDKITWLVKNNRGAVIGLLVKRPNTRHETHPWQAFKYNGPHSMNTLLGSFYGPSGRADALKELGKL